MGTLRTPAEDMERDVTVINYNDDEAIDVANTGSVPRAILTCRKTSHPFQERILNLEQPVKIGRSVARIRPCVNNGIFDCKVLSRNHAVMWYENEKFYIQDTKSSNGTYINTQRLGRGTEDSPPKEIWSGDVLQFGVDVLENQRKGNQESDRSDESVTIVTHGCIIATLKLIHPNGKEAKQGLVGAARATPTPKEELCALHIVVYEAQQREERLHAKLEELQAIIGDSPNECYKVHFEETRLLAKIEQLEKRIKLMNKIKNGEELESDVLRKLFEDLEQVQAASRVIQEKLHGQLVDTEQSLTVATQEMNSLRLDSRMWRDAAAFNENKLQELVSLCSNYSTTMNTLEDKLRSSEDYKAELESKVETLQKQEADLRQLLSEYTDPLISKTWDDNPPSIDKDIMLIEKCMLRDSINEEESWKLLKRLLETIFQDLEVTRKEYDELKDRKQMLHTKLETAREAAEEKTETAKDGDGDVINCIDGIDDQVTKLENELKLTDGRIWVASMMKKMTEARFNKIRAELAIDMGSQIQNQDVIQEKVDVDCTDLRDDSVRQIVETLRSENEKIDDSYEKPLTKDASSQTTATIIYPLDESVVDQELSVAVCESVDAPNPVNPAHSLIENTGSLRSPDTEVLTKSLSTQTNCDLDSVINISPMKPTKKSDEDSGETSETEKLISDDKIKLASETGSSPPDKDGRRLSVCDPSIGLPEGEISDSFTRIYEICESSLNNTPQDEEKIRIVKEALDAIREFLVLQISEDRRFLRRRMRVLDSMIAHEDATLANLNLVVRFVGVVVGVIFCFLIDKILEPYVSA